MTNVIFTANLGLVALLVVLCARTHDPKGIIFALLLGLVAVGGWLRERNEKCQN